MKKRVLIGSLIVILIDQLLKYIVLLKLNINENLVVVDNFFSLSIAFNTGASWSLLSNFPWLLIIISFLAMGIIIYYLFKSNDTKINLFAYSFLLGGLIGNLLDRIFRGYVVDFLAFKILGYNYPVFNFADIVIVMGAFLLAWSIFKDEVKNGN